MNYLILIDGIIIWTIISIILYSLSLFVLLDEEWPGSIIIWILAILPHYIIPFVGGPCLKFSCHIIHCSLYGAIKNYEPDMLLTFWLVWGCVTIYSLLCLCLIFYRYSKET